MAGELKVQVSADVGGLGAKQGPLVSYNWSLSNLLPPLIPWLLLLMLLALKCNRSPRAWLIWVPLIAWLGLCAGLQLLSGDIDSLRFLPPLQLLRSPAFAVAALWLLGSVLARWSALLRFVGGTVVIAAVGYMYFMLNTDWDEGFLREQQLYLTIALWAIAAGFAVSFGLVVAKFACRRQYHRLRLIIGLFIGLVLGWAISFGVSFLVAPLFNGSWDLSDLVQPILVTTGVTFVALLPFLVLSFASSFYRDRLQAWLHLEPPYSPPPSLSSLPVGTIAGQK